jgi:hypothetical protein
MQGQFSSGSKAAEAAGKTTTGITPAIPRARRRPKASRSFAKIAKISNQIQESA